MSPSPSRRTSAPGRGDPRAPGNPRNPRNSRNPGAGPRNRAHYVQPRQNLIPGGTPGTGRRGAGAAAAPMSAAMVQRRRGDEEQGDDDDDDDGDDYADDESDEPLPDDGVMLRRLAEFKRDFGNTVSDFEKP